MTLILTQGGRRWVMQVTDRLVTRRVGRDVRAFDAIANKNLVFLARDAIVSMAYTGLGFLDDVPTDQWLSETLRGERLPEYRPRRPAMLALSPGRRRPWRDLGQSLDHLHRELALAMSRVRPASWRNEALTIVMAGWQWNRRGRFRPVWILLDKPPGTVPFERRQGPRHFGHGYLLHSAPDGNLSAAEGEALANSLTALDVGASEDALVNTVRTVARRSPYVGPNCMCIILPPPPYRRVFIRYRPLVETMGQVTQGTSRLTVPIAFTPWVVGPNVTAAPTVTSGGGASMLNLGAFEVTLESDPPATIPTGQGLVSLTQSLTRPSPPR